MGGDEFCVLAPVAPGAGDELVLRPPTRSASTGEAFEIGCSYGLARIPREAATPEEALRLADQRMYEHKADRPTTRAARAPTCCCRSSPSASAGLARAPHRRRPARRATPPAPRAPRARGRGASGCAAELHDVGKTAIPDADPRQARALDDEEWEFMRRHTVIGERIIRAAPSLAHAAELVRSATSASTGPATPTA